MLHPSANWNFWPPEPVKDMKGIYGDTPENMWTYVTRGPPKQERDAITTTGREFQGGEQEIYLDVRGDVLFKQQGSARGQFDRAVGVMLMVDTPYGAVLANMYRKEKAESLYARRM